jgi:hypothetical protein
VDFVEIVFWVEDGGAFNKEVVFFLSGKRGGKEEKEQKSLHVFAKSPFRRFETIYERKYCRSESQCHEEMARLGGQLRRWPLQRARRDERRK